MAIYDDITQNLISSYGDKFGYLQDWQARRFAIDQGREQHSQALAQLFANGQNDLTNYGISAGFSRDAAVRRNGMEYEQAAAMYGLQSSLAAGDAAQAAQFASRLYDLQSGEAGTARDQTLRDLAARRALELEQRNTQYIQRGLENSGFQRTGMERSDTTYGNAQGDTQTAYQQAMARALYGKDYTTETAARQAANTAAMAALKTQQAGQDRDYGNWYANGQYDTGQRVLTNNVNLRNQQGQQDYDLWGRQTTQGFDFWNRQQQDRLAAQAGIRAAGTNANQIQAIINGFGSAYGF